MRSERKNFMFMKRKLLKIKPVVSTLIFSAAWMILSACGNAAEETSLSKEALLSIESHEAAEGVVTEERDETGAEAEDTAEEDVRHSEAEEIQENMRQPEGQIFLTDVTWEDFNMGLDGAVIHFSFSNGTGVAKELSYISIVERVEYRDITGDGADEVVICRELVNNAHDNYILMDFFEIEDDTVTEISPSGDIPELSDTAWDTEVVEDATEEYAIVLKMESCGKISGVLYTEKIMTVGYGKEGWVLIRQQEIPDWKLAYLDYLLKNTEAAMTGNWLFRLEDIDGDGIPELFYYDNAQLAGMTCKNGMVMELGEEKVSGEAHENGMSFDELLSILDNVE